MGDTGYFVVEAKETWQMLESQNPHIQWFFTPIEILPDVFKSDFKILSQVGEQYAGDA